MPESIKDRVTGAQGVRPLKALFYGPPGSGKTTLAATAPKPLLLDVEGGFMSVRDMDVDVFPIRSIQDVEDAIWTLANPGHKWKSVIVDSVTALQDVASAETNLIEALQRGPTKGTDPRNIYGQIAAYVRHWILLFNALPMNVILTAQLRFRDRDEDRVDPEEGLYPLVPDVSPSILRVLTAAPDVIGRTFVRDNPKGAIYAVQFGPDHRSVAKHRKLGLPREVANLTIPKLIKLTKGEKA